MRRKHLRLLANGSRVLLLGICCAAGGTAAIWRWWPELVVGADFLLCQRFVTTFRDRLAAIPEHPATERRAEYEQLLAELHWVRRQDQLADVVEACHLQLANLAESDHDLASAIRWLEQLITFDDHNLLHECRLAELECEVAELRSRGLARLTALGKRFPTLPTVVNALTSGYLHAGNVVAAARTIDTATTAMRGNLWSVVWDIGQGTERSLERRQVDTLPTREGDESVLRFRVGEAIVGLRLIPPTFQSANYHDLRLVYGTTTVDLTNSNTASSMIVVQPRLARSSGDSGAWISARWDKEIPADTQLEVRWRQQDLPELAYVRSLNRAEFDDWLNGPIPAEHAALAARIRTFRVRSILGRDMQLFWCKAGEGFSTEHQRMVSTNIETTPSGGSFANRFAIGEPADLVRLDFAEGKGLDYALGRCEVQAGDRTLSVDLATVELRVANNVERRDGRFVVTGPDPYFAFALPERPTPIVDSIFFAGEAR